MRILIASPEVTPFVKTGGLADVAGALANEYKKMGIEALIILPLYRRIKKRADKLRIEPTEKEITVPLGNDIETGRLWIGKTSEGAEAYFIENERFYNREELYGTPKGDYPDNASRFIFYCRGILETIKTLELNVEVLHCNDWQTSLIPVYLKTLYRESLPDIATLLTVHNLGYQGIFEHTEMPLTGLGWDMFHRDALEFHGKINFLKAGLLFADVITTVSNTYAKEIMTSEYGFGLDGVLRKRAQSLYGIINGVDYNEWDPRNDPFIPANYSRKDVSGKALCKKSLQRLCGLHETTSPLIGMVTRLSSQKGLDLVTEALDSILSTGAQMVILGKGEERFQSFFSRLNQKYKGQISVTIDFDNSLAHKIYAGADIFLMPSKYEPCGIGQLIALRYGAIPVVRATGGLADTIVEYNPATGKGTGFSFSTYSPTELINTIKGAIRLFNDREEWQKILNNAMSQVFSWHQSAQQYLSLYKKISKIPQRYG